MKIAEYFDKIFKKKNGSGNYTDEEIQAIERKISSMNFYKLSVLSSINLIANAVAKCEFRTFENKKEVWGNEHYLWNYEPNKNQSSSVFIHKVITKLLTDNECLVIEEGGQLLVADSHQVNNNGVDEAVFSSVTVGEVSFAREFRQSEVLFFQFAEKNIKRIIDSIHETYNDLVSQGMSHYRKSRETKLIFGYGTMPQGDTPQREAFDNLVNSKLKKFSQSENAILPLGEGQSLTDMKQSGRTYANETTRDIRAMIDDISDFVAKAFGIHPSLLRGDVQGTSDALEYTLTFCIDPLVDKIQEEINRKRNGRSGVNAGTYLMIDTKAIKHVDLLSVSTAVDKLIGSGAFCINDIRRVCGEEVIDEPFAWEHFITKNYNTMAEALAAVKGGEEE